MEPEKNDFDGKVQSVVRAVLAIGSFGVLASLVATGGGESIPQWFTLLGGAAIGIFIGGVPFKK